MEIKFNTAEGLATAEMVSGEVEIQTAQDALDFLMDCTYQGADVIIVRKENLSPAFFDLKSGLAGEILQKVSNYRLHFAIVGDFGNIESKSLSDFIRESNKAGRVAFAGSVLEALQMFSRK